MGLGDPMFRPMRVMPGWAEHAMLPVDTITLSRREEWRFDERRTTLRGSEREATRVQFARPITVDRTGSGFAG